MKNFTSDWEYESLELDIEPCDFHEKECLQENKTEDFINNLTIEGFYGE